MKEFVITADSTVDLPKEWLEEHHIPVLRLSYTIDGQSYPDMEGLSKKEFFDRIRAGAMPTTSQVTPSQAREFFESIVKDGKDIIHIGFSSGLSGSVGSEQLAAQELMEDYPDCRITVIDSLCACLGEALLLYYVLKQKQEGKAYDEIVTWAEENKLHVCHNVTVDDLHHLHRGGRISKATAVLGSMVKIKPIIHVDDNGKLVVIGKERGRKKSLHKIVDMMADQIKGWDNEIAMVTHGDCEEDAQYVADLIRKQYGIQTVLINVIGTVIGSHTGPGVVATFCMGNKR
ncbi:MULTISPECIES: DegV family protein [Sellimonas]|uniref:DegV family protein n=1 Tax=Sellimonas caecigallum TaxID=2592333 RepID=A0ABS7L3K9_9FIRM|nr:DegV family protein [uncultured Sellimonas sp.]MBY0757633.1 DegV family protein [Sellimonas caecigallum]OUP02813.1 fatty acid-binding protein DegV [Drancourtella sp. An210]OUP62578.1 fatty acid-binding protein DegV [Drancourtella sp. An177]